MAIISVNIKREPANYSIRVKRGLVTQGELPEGFVITDTNLIKEYSHLIKTDDLYVVESGEQSKTLETYKGIVKRIPKDVNKIISFGGGMVGDLAGFIASTFKRGVPLIQVPTTLLAMVDSSIGGKNGVNLGENKNQLGTIQQPMEVLSDPDFLKTLPAAEFINGIAEVIKYGVASDSSLLEMTQTRVFSDSPHLEDIIEKCCRIKGKVIEQDETGRGGYRNTLNLGHTLGHALEIPYKLSHGQAVAIGVLYELKFLDELGIPVNDKIQRVIKALDVNSLPSMLPEGADIEKIIELMKQDKKGALVFSFDNPRWSLKIKEEAIRAVFA